MDRQQVRDLALWAVSGLERRYRLRMALAPRGVRNDWRPEFVIVMTLEAPWREARVMRADGSEAVMLVEHLDLPDDFLVSVRCDSCSEAYDEVWPRRGRRACSSYCYADIKGICEPGY